MRKLLAHLLLHARHRGQWTEVGGTCWKYCTHRSHRLNLWCWRWATWDGYCPRHNKTCYEACPPAP